MKRQPEEDTIPTLSTKERLVLELLTGKPNSEMYGLELVEKSGGSLKRGTIYVTLGRMEDKGFVTSRQEIEDASRPGIPRRLYRLTGYGMRVYSAWAHVRSQLLPKEACPVMS
jgi:DNA-binding PadR family transcriptional regulator